MSKSSSSGALVALVSSLLFAGCAEPAADGCSTAADCPAGNRCTSTGSCEADVQGGGGAPPAEDECAGSDGCLPEPFDVVPTIYWDGSPSQPVCTVPAGRCTGEELCEIATACLPVQDGATIPGGFACERSDQCLSGRCLIVDGVGICLRACAFDQDCPYQPALGEVPAVGFACREVVEAGVPIKTCAPIDPAFPARTLCRRDCDCAPEDACDTGTLACRFVGTRDRDFSAMPVCEPPPAPEDELPTLAVCDREPDWCHGGACQYACALGGRQHGEHMCSSLPTRCTQPCDLDRDCPQRTTCNTAGDGGRAGDWMLPFQGGEPGGRELRFCRLPTGGCFDEVDCCPEPDGAGGCLHGWTAEHQRCVLERTSEHTPRVVTRCVAPLPGLTAPGSCCDSHEACDSGLCVPARVGTPCAGGGVCSVACDPDPDPDGIPGSGDERDRCALADFGPSTYHQESRCLPFDLALPYTDDAGQPVVLQTVIRACQ